MMCNGQALLFLLTMGCCLGCEPGNECGCQTDNEHSRKLLEKAGIHGWRSRRCIQRLLKESDIDVNCTDENGDTPLIKAARERRDTVGALLLAAGARTDIVNKDGETALLALLKAREDHRKPYDAKARFLCSILHTIEQGNNSQDIAKYLEPAMDLLCTFCRNKQYPPFRHSMPYNCRACFLYTLITETCQKMSTQHSKENSQLFAQAVAGNLPKTKELLTKAVGNDVLINAIDQDSLPAVTTLADAGMNVNKPSTRGEYPLLRAIFCGKSELAKYLHDRGASLDIKVSTAHHYHIYGSISLREMLDRQLDTLSTDQLIAAVPFLTTVQLDEIISQATRYNNVNVVRLLTLTQLGVIKPEWYSIHASNWPTEILNKFLYHIKQLGKAGESPTIAPVTIFCRERAAQIEKEAQERLREAQEREAKEREESKRQCDAERAIWDKIREDNKIFQEKEAHRCYGACSDADLRRWAAEPLPACPNVSDATLAQDNADAYNNAEYNREMVRIICRERGLEY